MSQNPYTFSISSRDHCDPCSDIFVRNPDSELIWTGKSGTVLMNFIPFTLHQAFGSKTVTAELQPPPKPIGYQRYVLTQNNGDACTLKQTKFWSGEMVMDFTPGGSCTFRLPQVIGAFKGESHAGWGFGIKELDWIWTAEVHGAHPTLLPCALALLYRQWLMDKN